MNSKPSKAVEKAWLARVAEYGCVITGQSNIQLHHCVGREGKSQKYHIGRWFVLPLEFTLHDVNEGANPLNITHHRKDFVLCYGSESGLFVEMCLNLMEDGPIPITEEEMRAIMATNR